MIMRGVSAPHFGKIARLVFEVIWLKFIQEPNCSLFSSVCEPWIIEHITTSSIAKGINSKPKFVDGLRTGSEKFVEHKILTRTQAYLRLD
jgi:hypothetical protein